jgi:hypothetical protein
VGGCRVSRVQQGASSKAKVAFQEEGCWLLPKSWPLLCTLAHLGLNDSNYLAMGAVGGSIPETLTKDEAKALAGDKWDEAAFGAAAVDGKITAEQFNAASTPAEAAAPKSTNPFG